jgi:hypothetical protein
VEKRPGGVIGFDVSRALFYTLAVLSLVGVSFGIGLQAGADKTPLYNLVVRTVGAVADSMKLAAREAPILAGTHPSHFLQPSRSAGDGVTVNKAVGRQDDLVFLAGFFRDSNELRLIRRNGEMVRRWPVRYYDFFDDTSHYPPGFAPATNWNIDLHGALAMPDGSVVFNFEWGGLVKLDRCGKLAWTLRRQTHHSVERAEAGGFWVLGRRLITSGSAFPPFEPPYHEDTILRISDEGAILSETSAVGLFYENGLAPLLTATGGQFHEDMNWGHEIVHANKIEELTSDLAGDFPLFHAGDLALSLRDQNLVVVFDPATRQVKWWRIGPWVRQHDPEFRPGGTIVVFNNNVHHTSFGDRYADFKVLPSAPQVSNILEVDPKSGNARILYGGKPGQELLSVIKGNVEVTPGGGLLITEAQGGRVLELDASGNLVWQYVNRYDADEVAELGEARLYPAEYFHVKDWSCQ